MKTIEKLDKLRARLQSFSGLLIAYSGGVDSTFLLAVARETNPRLLSVIATSPTYPKAELTAAKALCRKLKVKYLEIKTDEFTDERFLQNSTQRCYFCKKELFSKLKNIAKDRKLEFVADGSNADDLKDFRPGSRAKKELGVISPLQEAGLTKAEIRKLSKKMGLPTWDKPSLACLSSRIPYGTRLTGKLIKRVGLAEDHLRSLGFKQVRVRDHQEIARIEVEQKEIPLLVKLRKDISKKLKTLGYTYVTFDLEGYRTGSMNAIIKA